MTPFFSIIVVTYNAGDKLRPTIDSILNQTFTDIEIIVKDACSTDGSLMTIPYDRRITPIIGADHGIYDGMNIAVKAAKGKFLYFLNTGDYLEDTEVLGRVHDEILLCLEESKNTAEKKTAESEADSGNAAEREADAMPETASEANGGADQPSKLVVYGDVYERHSGQVAAAKPVMDDFALFRNVPNHQACFYSRELFADRGFDTGLKVRADYEHFLYCHYIAGAKMHYLPVTIADYEGGGFSETSKNREISREEHKMVTQMYMPMSKVLLYRAYLIVTLQPLREKIAQNPRTAYVYDSIKKKVYHR